MYFYFLFSFFSLFFAIRLVALLQPGGGLFAQSNTEEVVVHMHSMVTQHPGGLQPADDLAADGRELPGFGSPDSLPDGAADVTVATGLTNCARDISVTIYRL